MPLAKHPTSVATRPIRREAMWFDDRDIAAEVRTHLEQGRSEVEIVMLYPVRPETLAKHIQRCGGDADLVRRFRNLVLPKELVHQKGQTIWAKRLADDIEEIIYLLENREHPIRVAERMGTNPTALSRRLYRAGERELARFFTRYEKRRMTHRGDLPPISSLPRAG